MLSDKATKVQMILEFRKPHSLTSRDLSEITGDSRENIRKIINELRTEGIPVCSTNAGYFISENPRDIEKTVNSLEGRIRSIKGAAMGLRICIAKAQRG